MALTKTELEKLEKQPFEKCLEDLDDLVREMESGNVALEEMISKFETGSAIAAVCHKKLNALKQKIELLQNPKEDPKNDPADPSSGSDLLFPG